MADKEQPKQKRRLRAPSETVRQKATKAQESSAATSKRGRTRSVVRGFFMPIRLVGRGLAWLAHRPPLKQLGHGLRWFFSRRPVRFLGKMLGIGFMRNSLKEVKLVTWPTWKMSLRLTGAVIIFSVIFGGLIALVDLGLNDLFKHIILKK